MTTTKQTLSMDTMITAIREQTEQLRRREAGLRTVIANMKGDMALVLGPGNLQEADGFAAKAESLEATVALLEVLSHPGLSRLFRNHSDAEGWTWNIRLVLQSIPSAAELVGITAPTLMEAFLKAHEAIKAAPQVVKDGETERE